MMYKLYDKIMNVVTTILFGLDKGINILRLEWDHLIILDACRCDIFEQIYKEFFTNSNIKLECIKSSASSTMEFVRKNFNDSLIKDRMKDVVFVNSNPMIDYTLGKNIKNIFYKYIPIWRKYWDFKLGTVRPEDVYYSTLKVFLKYPNKSFIIWFLQPHYPYIDEKYKYISSLGREFMNKSIMYSQHETSAKILMKLLKNIISKRCLAAGIPDELAELMRKDCQKVFEAYTMNLYLVLKYVKKLTEVLPGQIVISSDHGEAFGEPLSKFLPIPVYGHPSRVRISSLIKVPYLIIENNITQKESFQKAFKIYLARVNL